ncbi:receptor-type tyrosine-protein phosphatase N2 isoform X3 [Hemicordylus capensis]|uniref:receptor-type tyrosine-protein phosphatase N2 isoform X3 n=1 Tax=Hemicordylus capensis TaxID=884348 RepID=UPI0023023AB7|nr:receptor-type tyrosine-protein phosphatase N2 isoform X3 [Hemicordylus capensis]
MMGSPGSSLPLRLLQQLLLLLVVARHRHHLLGAAAAAPPAGAEARFGCLFEDDLCKSFEICINDGVFGRCQRVPVIDVYKYEVSPPILQRLRIVLEKLLHRGFTWQDDYTQHIIARELSNLHKIHDWHPETFSSEEADARRTAKQSADSNRNLGMEEDMNFAKSPQQYLAYLDILSQSAAPNLYSRIKGNKASLKVDSILPDSIINYMVQNPKGKTSALTHSTAAHTKHTENFPVRTFGQTQAHQFPLKPKEEFDREALLAALNAYITQKVAAKNLDGSSSVSRSKESSLYSNRLKPPQIDHLDGTLSKEKTKDFEMRPSFLQRPGSGLVPSSAQGDLRVPLTTMDEIFIQDVLRDLKKHHVDVDKLNPLELDEMADIIADAIQAVDVDEEKKNAAGKVEGERAEKRVDAEGKDDGVQKEDAKAKMEKNYLGAKQLDFLNGNMATENLPLSKESFKTEMKKSEDSDLSSSSEEVKAGIENVKSETFSKELIAEKKAELEPKSKELTELRHWNTLIQDESAYEETKKKLGEGLQLDAKSSKEEEYGYIVTEKDPLSEEKGLELMEEVAGLRKLQMTAFADINMVGPAVTFKLHSNVYNVTTADVANAAANNKEKLEKATGLKILQIGMGEKSKLQLLPRHAQEEEDATKFIILTLLSIACIFGILVASGVIYCLRHSSHHKLKEKLTRLGSDSSSDATAAYQELCRQRMAVKSTDHPEPLHASRINSISSQFSDGPIPSPSARSSTSSWCEEPVQSNMDISTGHMILSYMEDHLKNKNRLEKEWEALCAYQAEPNATTIAHKEENVQKNRSQDVVAYDHCRICLKAENSHDNSDYINASPIMDHDPRNPAYIAAQGALPSTVTDFWQMVWENGCVVIVMLTPLAENGVKQCYHYWPDEGSNLYHIYEVNLVSEHIWCEDFLVRSFYLKNLQTNETRTVTQFHFLTWHDQKVPASTRSLLDFRRKVNKCYRGRSCPVIVHCSDGAGRSGTYILIDMVLNKMAKGAKEIDIAATLEHLRDQRPDMVQTKEQFEFALTAVAEEVNAILKALPQ